MTPHRNWRFPLVAELAAELFVPQALKQDLASGAIDGGAIRIGVCPVWLRSDGFGTRLCTGRWLRLLHASATQTITKLSAARTFVLAGTALGFDFQLTASWSISLGAMALLPFTTPSLRLELSGTQHAGGGPFFNSSGQVTTPEAESLMVYKTPALEAVLSTGIASAF